MPRTRTARRKYANALQPVHVSNANMPRMVEIHLPRSRPRSVVARRLVTMRRTKRTRRLLRLLPLRRPGRAKPRSQPTTTKMFRPSKLPRQRDEPRRPSQSRRLMKLPSKLRRPRRRAAPRRSNLSLKLTMSLPLSSPRRRPVLKRPRLSLRLTRKRPRSLSPSPSPSLSPLPRKAAERRRLLPTVMTSRPRPPRPLLQSEVVPRRGKHNPVRRMNILFDKRQCLNRTGLQYAHTQA